MVDLLFKDEVFKIVGAAMNVYNELGFGFLEAVYQEALEIEFKLLGIPYEPQCQIEIKYKSFNLKKRYVSVFIVYDGIIVEIKAESDLCGDDEAQLLNYLKATGKKCGVLINFGNKKDLQWKRRVM